MGRREAKPRLTQATASSALARWGHDPLCVCGCGGAARFWHHVFDQQHYPGLVDEIDNVVPVAGRCHELHTKAIVRYPRSVARYAERLATTPQMSRYLERNYA
jgi:hypothetical protein